MEENKVNPSVSLREIFIYNCLALSFLILYVTGSSFPIFRSFLLLNFILIVFFVAFKTKKIIISNFTLFVLMFFILASIINRSFDLYISVFFCFILIIQPLTFNLDSNKLNKIINNSLIFLIGLSLLIYLSDGYSLNQRFSGFSGSGTTYSTYLLAIFTFIVFLEDKLSKKIFYSIPVIFFIIISQTRTSFLLFLGVIVLYYFRFYVGKRLSFFFFISLIAAILYYPIINLASIFVNLDITGRYDDVDYSTMTRLTYFTNQVNALINMDLLEILFGKGINESLKIGSKNSYSLIDQHNDFFTLIYDYGIIFLIVFLTFLKKQCTSVISLAIVIIYLFSFYHNMVYDILLIFLIYLARNSQSQDHEIHKTC